MMGMFSNNPRPVITSDHSKGAKQAFKDEVDINSILRRHRSGAMVTHVNANPGRFADVSEITDYRGMLERVRSAEEYFMGLSSKVRTFFQNDTGEFLDWISDPANGEKLRELGLGPAMVDPPVPPVEPPAPPVEPPAPPVEPPAPPPA